MEAVIILENLAKYYNLGTPVEVRALEDISLTVDRNEYVLIHGPSGSGKTTLLNVMATLDRPSRGALFLFERNLDSAPDVRPCTHRRGNSFSGCSCKINSVLLIIASIESPFETAIKSEFKNFSL